MALCMGAYTSKHPLCLIDSSKAINHHIYFQDVNKSTFSIASFFLGTWYYPPYLLLQHKPNTKNVCLKKSHISNLSPFRDRFCI